MKLRPSVLELVVADMAVTLAFYRRLGLDIAPEADGQPHAEIDLGCGMRLAWDDEDTIRSFDPGWRAVTGTGHRVALALPALFRWHVPTAGSVPAAAARS